MPALPDDLRIRLAEPGDVQRLREIFAAAKGSWGYDRALVEEAAADLDFSAEAMQAKEVYVAEVAGEPVAFASIVRGPDVWRLDDLWVDPAWMGRGIGRHLFMYAADQARKLGARRLEWETDPNAVGFYEKMGASTCATARPRSGVGRCR